ncbi:hypothetical protein AQUCO_02600202v1 [Aquilegia coerulea]|uniref:BUD13 homolog n=1 Tax=Aquilegia coerulea TaxID=218851 RepID=A0A2G5D7V2_AQUCA|nr:hypothetical protein AQUCO_02600202v1 [Aquilegia coerulea]
MESSAAISRKKEYLKKYGLNDAEDVKKNKKKKSKKSKKPQTSSSLNGVLVVDEDPVWQKPVQIHEEDDDDDDSGEEKPQVEEDIEVKRMKRMEQIRARNHGKSADGSGWVVVSDVSAANADDGSRRNDSPDISPPRRRTRNDSPDNSTPRHKRKDSPDISPPRHTRNDSPDNSPRQRKRKDSPDISPPRRNRSDDMSPPRRNRPILQNVDSLDEDISPPRRNRPGSHLAENLSPPRRNRPSLQNINSEAEDISPPRRSQFHSKKPDDLGADISPPRRNRPHLSDLSPPRKRKSSSKEEAKTGLLTAQEVKSEIERKRKEELARYKALDPSVSGRGAEPVYRDKTGKRITKDEMLKSKKGEEKPKEIKLEWGKGLAQKKEAEAKEHELELEKERPFARTRDDPELEKMLKEQVRWGDPMAHLVKRKQSDLILEDLGDNEKMKESGFIVPQNIPNHSWIKRRIEAAPNRYGIRPGRHWDGVDRSNGTEKEYFKRKNEKQATEREAYLWSVSDM